MPDNEQNDFIEETTNTQPEDNAGEQNQPETAEQGGDERMQQAQKELAALSEAGWTAEDAERFLKDEKAAADINGGMSISVAASRYILRQSRENAAAKRGVPTARSASNDGVSAQAAFERKIERMDKKEFAEYYQRMKKAAFDDRKVKPY